MRGYPQFSFWISITLVKIYISYIIINRSKNTFEVVGTALNASIKFEKIAMVMIRYNTLYNASEIQ